MLRKNDENLVNYFGKISYKFNRKSIYINKEENIEDIKVSVLKKRVEENYENNNKINEFIKIISDDEEKFEINEDEKKEIKICALNNIIDRESPFRLVYTKESICENFREFIEKNNLFIFLFLYFFFNIASISCHNYIDNNYIQKKNINYLITNYYYYLIIILVFGLCIGTIFMFGIQIVNVYYVYGLLMFINIHLIIFYALRLFKNYYNFYTKQKNNFSYFEIFLTSNLYCFIIQNLYSEKKGSDFLTINAIVSIVDFIYFLFEFIIIDWANLDKYDKILNILSFIISLGIESFLIFLITIYVILGFGCCDVKELIQKFYF